VVSIRNQTYNHANIEVIIVVNDIDHDTPPFRPQENEIILYEPNHFSYAARNEGIRASSGDVIAFIDSDAVAEPNWLTEGVAAIIDGADLVAGHVDLTTRLSATTAAGRYEKLFAFDQEKNARSGYSATVNLFARRSTIESVGLFDESARTGEDFAWTRAAWIKGFRLVYSPSAIVSHPARETWSELFAKARRTASLVIGSSGRDGSASARFLQRIRHQLATPPSPNRLAGTTARDRIVAYGVRGVLAVYKAIWLVRLTQKEGSIK
jgi:glycosyltransferase involved in cell wall biosynthesis